MQKTNWFKLHLRHIGKILPVLEHWYSGTLVVFEIWFLFLVIWGPLKKVNHMETVTAEQTKHYLFCMKCSGSLLWKGWYPSTRIRMAYAANVIYS